MFRKNILFILFILVGHSLWAQCPSQDITLRTQAQVDSFQLLYPNCTELPVSLTLSGEGIVNTDSLANLKSIGGTLDINFTGLSTISGFDSLKYVSGSILISQNEPLELIDGFNQLDSLGGSININNNFDIESIIGFQNLKKTKHSLIIQFSFELAHLSFPSLQEVEQDLILSLNFALDDITGFPLLNKVGRDLIIEISELKSISGLNALEEVGGNVFMFDNRTLKQISGLQNLRQIGKSFLIIGQLELESLEGFNALTQIGGRLEISSTDSLRVIHGFNYLNSLGNSLIVSENRALRNFKGFHQLDSIARDLMIMGNPKLRSCCAVFPILQDSLVGGATLIAGNSPACNSIEQILNGGPCIPIITDVEVIDATADTLLFTLKEGDVIDLSKAGQERVDFRAKVFGKSRSVRFILDGATTGRWQASIENKAPYALFGNIGNDYRGDELGPQKYTLMVMGFTKPGAMGESGDTLSLNFEVTGREPGGIQGFQLIDAEENRIISNLGEGSRIFLPDLTTRHLAIKAFTQPDKVGSVVFHLEGAISDTTISNEAPYSLFGLKGNQLDGKVFLDGSYQLRATPYTQVGGQGEAGSAATINFTLQPAVTLPFVVYPNVTEGQITVSTSQMRGDEGKIQIYNSQGNLLYTQPFKRGIEPKLDLSSYESGIYFINVMDDGAVYVHRVLLQP